MEVASSPPPTRRGAATDIRWNPGLDHQEWPPDSSSKRMLTRLDFDSVHAHATVADLIEPLRQAFAQGMNAPPRNHYELGTPGATNSLLVMPGWRVGGH